MSTNYNLIDIKKSINLMRGKKTSDINEVEIKILNENSSVQDMVRHMRLLKEDNPRDLKNMYDQNEEESKMNDYFKDLKVVIEYQPLEVNREKVWFGGIIDGKIAFTYKVTADESNAGFNVDYLEDFDSNILENSEILKRIEQYYDVFYKYWRDSVLQQE